MDIPYNQLYKNQNRKLIPDKLRKAIVSKVNVSQRQADIYFVNNPETVVKNVPVSNAVDINSLAEGDRVKIDLFDETNPKDIIIGYSYGGKAASGENVTITYVSGVILNNPSPGTYTITVLTKILTFVGGKLLSHT